MTIFIDTSALYSLADQDEAHHAQADAAWNRIVGQGPTLVTTNYVLLETAAILQRRLGLGALLRLHRDITPLLKIEWITPEGHKAAVEES